MVDKKVIAADLADISLVAAGDSLRFDGATWKRHIVREINARDRGATGNGSTDDSAAFSGAFTDALATKILPTYPGANTNRLFQTQIDIPAGVYIITSGAAFMTAASSIRTQGLRFRGAGREATTIVFQPTVDDSYLLDNEDYYLNLTFEDLTFVCDDPTSSFMKSVSNGGSQNYVFNRVNWKGTWRYGIELLGGNNNSEMTWFHCGVYGNWTAFLYSAASGTSDQFVNYNFYTCQIEYTAGNFVDLSMGGNVNVWGGSLIHNGNGAAAQVFFNLPVGDHARGVQRLLVQGVRVEHKHALSQLINCKWKRGNITVRDCDTESQASTLAYTPTALIQAEFGATNNTKPEILFDNCTLMGAHKYSYFGSDYDYARRVVYRSCEIVNFTDAHSFVITDNTSASGNVGSATPVEFINCRGSTGTGGYKYPFDCVLNWDTATGASPRKRVVSLKNAQGTLPLNSAPTVGMVLPLNAIITRVSFHKGNSGSSTATAWSYTLADADGLVLATGLDPSTQWRFGFDIDVELWARLSTDNKRTLTLTAAGITQTAVDSLCLVEYLA